MADELIFHEFENVFTCYWNFVICIDLQKTQIDNSNNATNYNNLHYNFLHKGNEKNCTHHGASVIYFIVVIFIFFDQTFLALLFYFSHLIYQQQIKILCHQIKEIQSFQRLLIIPLHWLFNHFSHLTC